MKPLRHSEQTYCPECGNRMQGNLCASCSLAGLMDVVEGVPIGKISEGQQLDIEFGRYLLKERLDAGGMGVVYIARDRQLKRTVALKMIRGSTFASESDMARFTLEAEAAAALDHPHIVPIYEIGAFEEQPFFTMKLISGRSLAKRLQKDAGGILGASEAAELISKVAAAVHHAHQRGVLHRDLKPANIIIDESGEPWLTDFGLAKLLDGEQQLTRTTAQIGTTHYMPPEIVRGQLDQVSTGSDLWALGVMLWQLVYGELPFTGASPAEIMRKIETESPKAVAGVAVARDLRTLALRCLEKDPAKRMQSAGELAEDLYRWLAGRPIQARAISPAERLVKWARRKPVWAALYVALAAGVASSLLLWQRAERAVDSLTAGNERLNRALAVSSSTKLALDARSQVNETPIRALLLAAEAVERAESDAGKEALPKAAEALQEILFKVAGRDVSPSGPVSEPPNTGFMFPDSARRWHVKYSPDGGRAVSLDFYRGEEVGVIAAVHRVGEEGLPAMSRWRVFEKLAEHCAYTWMPDSKRLLVGEAGDLVMMDFSSMEERPSPDRSVIGSINRDGSELFYLTLQAEGKGARGHGVFRQTEAGPEKGALRLRDFSVNEEGSIRAGELDIVLPEQLAECRIIHPDGVKWLFGYSGEQQTPAWFVPIDRKFGERQAVQVEEGEVFHSAISLDGRWLAYRKGSGTVVMRDLHEGAGGEARVLDGIDGGVQQLVFSPDSNLLAIAGMMPTISVYSVESGERVGALRGTAERIGSLCFSHSGEWLVAGGDSKVLEVWRVDEIGEAPAIRTLRGLNAPILDIRFSPDDSTIIATVHEGVQREWQFADGQQSSSPLYVRGSSAPIVQLAVSPDQNWVATVRGRDRRGSEDEHGRLELSQAKGGGSFTVERSPVALTDVAFSRDGRWLARTGNDGFAKVWDIGRLQSRMEGQSSNTEADFVFDMAPTRLELERRLAFGPDGRLFLVCGDGILFIWDLNSTDPASAAEAHRVHSRGYLLPDVAVSPDGNLLAVARFAWDSEPIEGWTQSGSMVLLFDISSPGAPVTVAELPAPFVQHTSLAFSADGQWLAAGGSGTGAAIWDLSAEDIVSSRLNSPMVAEQLHGIAFDPDGEFLSLGGSDGQLHLWNWRSGVQRTVDTGSDIGALAWPAPGFLCSGGQNGRLGIWETRLEALKRTARRVAGRELSEKERQAFDSGISP